MDPKALEELKAGLSLHIDAGKASHVVLVEEYKALWTYYIRTLDERGRIFDVYFKIITFPLLLSGAIVFYLRSIGAQSQATPSAKELGELISIVISGLSIFFALSFIAGILAYLYYSLESANSRIYLRAMSAIRADWRERYSLEQALVIDILRPKSRYLGDWIVHARGSVFAMFNSSILFVAAWFYYGSSFLVGVLSRPIFSFGMFLLAIALHVMLGVVAMRIYSRSPAHNEIDKGLDKKVALQVGSIVKLYSNT